MFDDKHDRPADVEKVWQGSLQVYCTRGKRHIPHVGYGTVYNSTHSTFCLEWRVVMTLWRHVSART